MPDTKPKHAAGKATRNKTDTKSGSGGSRASSTGKVGRPHIDSEIDRYPYCIVWTPLPLITWLVPLIGHAGVANSKGIIYDFSDDFNVSVDNFAFGTPTKYYQFNPESVHGGADAWDKAIQDTSDVFCRTRHSLFFNNCHQYIADALNRVNYADRNNWTQTDVWYKITFKSTYTDCKGFFRQWLPFAGISIAIITLLALML